MRIWIIMLCGWAAGCGGEPSAPSTPADPLAPPRAPAEPGAEPADEEPSMAEPPAYAGRSEPLPDTLRQQMTGVSWRPGCPVGLDDLALLRIPHWGFDDRVHVGEMIVASAVADDVLGVFGALYDARFPVERMRPVHEYAGNDDASMAANNSSAFNCRPVMGTKSWSKHSYGRAVDINPVQNPYLVRGKVYPPAGQPFVNREVEARGMIHDGDVVVRSFAAIGWEWGGHWTRVKDYQHFEVKP